MTVNATFEPGLSGTGPPPVHLHTGKPTPWSEGCVVRFTSNSGECWVGNLQAGYGYARKIVLWDDASAFVIIANGASYFVRPDNPDDWRFFDLLGIDCVLSPSNDLALLTTYTDLVAISPNGNPVWRRSVAVDGVEITRIEDGLVHGLACIDPPEDWYAFVLRLDDGNDVTQSHPLDAETGRVSNEKSSSLP